jgi:iron-sulfur cluster assembly accessory protein
MSEAHAGGSCCSEKTEINVEPPVTGAVSGMPVVLTDKAVEMVKHALKEEGLENHGLRVAVQGGGCSGLQYALDYADAARPGDHVYDQGGLKIFIDMASAQFLNGTTIDYVSGLQGNGFKFNNPNARRTCGCGSSFS